MRSAPCSIEGCPRPLVRYLPTLCRLHADRFAEWAQQQADLETRSPR